MQSDTIAAVATPLGVGGVGIVRVSGNLVPVIAQAITGSPLLPRKACFSTFRDHAGEIIDQGIALYFAAPGSFTGEDVLELQGHGGPVVLDLVLQRCLELGARLAGPGEFSERAFLNGKMDLAQAEAVADLIESATALSARLAARTLQGVFSDRIHALNEQLVELRIYLEATLDFSEEEIDFIADGAVAQRLSGLMQSTRSIMEAATQGCRLHEGLAVVIAGAPNAGKSSLLNALSGSDEAIVTAIPGTTRDLLKVDIQVDGLPIRVIDTAGIRHSEDPIEQEGVRRARSQLSQADLVLWVYDSTVGPDASTRENLPADIPVTRIRNKIDLLGETARLAEDAAGPEISLSIRDGKGLELLREHLKSRAGVSSLGEGAFTARRRHLDALRRSLSHLESAAGNLDSRSGIEFVAEDLHQAQHALGEITGEFSSDDLLGRIFGSFCIGK